VQENTFSNKLRNIFLEFFETFNCAILLNTSESLMNDNEKQFETSKELEKELKKLFIASDSVPPEVDRKIAAMADKHFARRKAGGRVVALRWAGRAAAAAAVVFITVLVYFQFESGATLRKTTSNKEISVARESGGSGVKVTILDAFALARNIDAGKKIDKTWDWNDDGVVDRKDVDAVAFAAVRLHDGAEL
jgi:hypothetical protein